MGAEDAETGRRATLFFTVPEGSQALNFDGPGLGERYLDWGTGFADTVPVPPGTATVETLFNYELPFWEGMQVARTFDVPVASVVMMLSEEGMALEGNSLALAPLPRISFGLESSTVQGYSRMEIRSKSVFSFRMAWKLLETDTEVGE